MAQQVKVSNNNAFLLMGKASRGTKIYDAKGSGDGELQSKALEWQEGMRSNAQNGGPYLRTLSVQPNRNLCKCVHMHIFIVYSSMHPLLWKFSLLQNDICKAHSFPWDFKQCRWEGAFSDPCLQFSANLCGLLFTYIVLDIRW